MTLLAASAARILDVVDALFDASAALVRVALRGAFAPDAKAFRGPRFAALPASDVLIQEIALNAADASEAKKALALDLEQVLPLSPEAIAFDVVGPLVEDNGARARPERRFILGAVRLEQLAARRRDAGGAIEGFVFHPPALAGAALVFVDEASRKRRRLRRALLAAALAALLVSAGDAYNAVSHTLETAAANVDTERTRLERRIRLAERRLTIAETHAAAARQNQGAPIGQVGEQIAALARRQPLDAETTRLGFADGVFTWTGRGFDLPATELELRRGFETQGVSFVAQSGEAPQSFEASFRASAPEMPP
jgi:hypothetical protein